MPPTIPRSTASEGSDPCHPSKHPVVKPEWPADSPTQPTSSGAGMAHQTLTVLCSFKRLRQDVPGGPELRSWLATV